MLNYALEWNFVDYVNAFREAQGTHFHRDMHVYIIRYT